VEAILNAQAYTTYRSPQGVDSEVDILAGAGALGFGSRRICVDVKSGGTPIDRPSVDKLLGAVRKFGGDQGLFVSWSGFTANVQKELATTVDAEGTTGAASSPTTTDSAKISMPSCR
jgi:restriction system protein